MLSLATILIAARNASGTIERVIRSAVSQGPYPIILIDDFSTDDTVARARVVAGSGLKVVRPPRHESLGLTRQTGLMTVDTPYGIWIDADDELLPGRVDCMVAALGDDGADLVSDEVELYDGPTNTFREILHIPGFLKGHHPLARLFERNYLPGIGVIGFRTEFARRIGYDPLLHGAEDIDFALRAIAATARFSLLNSIGYRLHAYPSSLSRSIENQRKMYRTALRKHPYHEVDRLLRVGGYVDRIRTWAMGSMAIFREDYSQALAFVDALENLNHNPDEILEPGGPCPRPEGWLISFHRGTLLYLMNRNAEAIRALERAQKILPTAEGANNLGACLMQAGDNSGARMLFVESLRLYPEYQDAQHNLSGKGPLRVATHPLRGSDARRDYGAFPIS
jgi:glycosyltransferase involved in cell wall biosynthesis